MIKVMLILRYIYRTVLRELIVNAIDNPNSEVDEFFLKLLDNIFEYDG